MNIGIIGGSGLDNPDFFETLRDEAVGTPYGEPSSPLKHGKIGGVDVVLLARHGRGHTLAPTQVNYRANIHALKMAGCTHILATTAVGSLREEIRLACSATRCSASSIARRRGTQQLFARLITIRCRC